MGPMISSGQVGTSGSCEAASARNIMLACPFPVACAYPARCSGSEDERRHEADQGKRLGQREPDPHVKGEAAARLGLTGHRLDRVTEDQADADARADGRETVPERT